MKKYCENCEKKTETQIVEKRETYEVYGEPIEINAKILICTECGEELYCEKLDNDTLTNHSYKKIQSEIISNFRYL